MFTPKHFKNSFLVLLVLLMVFTVAACSKGNKENNTPANNTANNTEAPGENTPPKDEEKPKEPVTITILHGKGTNFPEQNQISEEINKRTGVNVKFISAEYADMETRINTAIASGDIPDIIENPNKRSIAEMAENGVIRPLDDLLKEHGQGILENKGEFLKGPVTVDGQIYAIPRAWGFGNALALRKDWLDKLKLEVPKTLDDYYKVLDAFVNQDPDGNGKKDTVGVGTVISFDATMHHFFNAHGAPFKTGKYIDGQVVAWPLQPGWLDAVKFMNKLYHDGLMEPEFATMPFMQEFEKLWNGKVGAFEFFPTGTTQNWVSRYVEEPKPEFVYTVIKGPNGEGGSLKFIGENAGSFVHITTASKHPEEAMKVLNFLNSEEGDKLTFVGIEGKHHNMKDGKVEWIPPYDDAVQFRNEGGTAYNAIVYRVGGMEYQMLNETTKQGVDISFDNPVEGAYLYDVPKIEQEMGKVLDDMVVEAMTSLIISKGDLDKEYEKFKAEYLKAGGETWMQQATEIYKKENNIN